MSTIATRLTGVNPAPNAPIIALPSDIELALLNSTNLVEWWRPDNGYNDTTGEWLGRKANTRLYQNAPGSISRTVGSLGLDVVRRTLAETSPIYTVLLTPPDQNLWPITGGYTFVYVVSQRRRLPALAAGLWCNAVSAGAYTGLAAETNPEVLTVRHSGLVVQAVPTEPVQLETPVALVWSFDYTDRVGRWLNSAGETILESPQVASNNIPTSQRLTLFGNRDDTNTFIAAAGFDGDLYDGFVLNAAVHKDANLQALVLDYIAERYAGMGV